MTRHLFPKFLAAFLIVTGLCLLLAAPAGATSQRISSSPSSALSSGTIHQSPAQIRAYWTVERMKSARSADELVAHFTSTVPPTVRHGGSGVGAPALPRHRSQGIIPDASSVPTGSYRTFPYSTVGKVFFTDSRTNTNYVCSGAAANSTNKSVVDTAGHCVIQGGSGNNWYTNWQFCPQYYNGSTPFGCWSARQLWSSNDWINSGSLEDDFGDAVVSTNSSGAVVNVVGGVGYAYGLSTSQTFTSLGYPQAAPFNGTSMYQCGPTTPSTVSGYDDGQVIGIPCDMTGGSSGGPWLISYSGAFGYVNGHNDFKYNNDSAHMYSPYYDSDWFNVFNSAQNA
jgi:V8-like Glu-specific endopeptidase